MGVPSIFFVPVGTVAILTEGGEDNHKMAAVRGGASDKMAATRGSAKHKMSGNKVILGSDSNSI